MYVFPARVGLTQKNLATSLRVTWGRIMTEVLCLSVMFFFGVFALHSDESPTFSLTATPREKRGDVAL